jgi:hypothetical protein
MTALIIDKLKQTLQKDAYRNQDPDRHAGHLEIMEDVNLDFIDWLGES